MANFSSKASRIPSVGNRPSRSFETDICLRFAVVFACAGGCRRQYRPRKSNAGPRCSCASAIWMLTAQALNSGIFASGSSRSMVSTVAAGSGKCMGTKATAGIVWCDTRTREYRLEGFPFLHTERKIRNKILLDNTVNYKCIEDCHELLIVYHKK